MRSPDETIAFGEKIGARLRGGECFELISDVGGGKTTFVRGLAAGMGSENSVGSPTFTISKEYRTPDKSMYHFDFYRLDDAGIVAEELSEALGDKEAIIVIEWADNVAHVLPKERIVIRIAKQADSPDGRDWVVQYPTTLHYLFEDEA